MKPEKITKDMNESEELGSWTKEMLKPENLMGPYKTTEEMMAATWFAEDDD